jgi:chromosome segregation ATPase
VLLVCFLESSATTDALQCPDSPNHAVSRMQMLKKQHAKALADTDEARLQLQQELSGKKSEITRLESQLAQAELSTAAAQEALSEAKSAADSAAEAARSDQQQLRRQLLEVRGERLQLQEQLIALQHQAGNQQQVEQHVAAAKELAAAQQKLLQEQVAAVVVEKGELQELLRDVTGEKNVALKQVQQLQAQLQRNVLEQQALTCTLQVSCYMLHCRYGVPVLHQHVRLQQSLLWCCCPHAWMTAMSWCQFKLCRLCLET